MWRVSYFQLHGRNPFGTYGITATHAANRHVGLDQLLVLAAKLFVISEPLKSLCLISHPSYMYYMRGMNGESVTNLKKKSKRKKR